MKFNLFFYMPAKTKMSIIPIRPENASYPLQVNEPAAGLRVENAAGRILNGGRGHGLHLLARLPVGQDTSVGKKALPHGQALGLSIIGNDCKLAKELLFYGEMSLGEIASRMNYSSTAYLSSQFKSVTGMTPTQFKAMRKKELKQLDKI